MKKKTILLSLALIFGVISINAQETTTAPKRSSQAVKQLNFGFLGVSYEIPLGKSISIAPFAGTDFDLDWLTLGAKGNFYFDNLLNLPNEWDVYGGASAGFAMGMGSDNSNADDFNMGLHVGGRWFWNDKWGVYAEYSGGTTAGTSGIGLTMRL